MDLREAFIDGLIVAGKAEGRILVLDADVSRTSRSRRFRDAFPDRFHDVGIAEQNMLGIGAGLAAAGLVPFTVGFSVFLSLRACEQIRTSVCYPNLGVKIVGGYAALSNAKDGATHQCLEDLAILNSFPNLKILTVSDPSAARAAAGVMAATPGPVFLRLEYEDLPDFPVAGRAGEIAPVRVLRDGGDVTIASMGAAAHRAMRAAGALAERGIAAEVLDFAWLKPFPAGTLLGSVRRTGRLVTVEDHNRHGGLSSMASAILMENGVACRFGAVRFEDVFTESGGIDELRAKYGVDEAAIVRTVERVVSGKGKA